MAARCFIQCRVSADLKLRFQATARARQLSESTLMRRMLELALDASGETGASPSTRQPAIRRSARVTVRLDAEVRRLLHERASARRLAPATYISLLTGAHLRGDAPLPKVELAALKRSVTELGGIADQLRRLADDACAAGRTAAPSRQELLAILTACDSLRRHTKEIIRANLASWQISHG